MNDVKRGEKKNPKTQTTSVDPAPTQNPQKHTQTQVIVYKPGRRKKLSDHEHGLTLTIQLKQNEGGNIK